MFENSKPKTGPRLRDSTTLFAGQTPGPRRARPRPSLFPAENSLMSTPTRPLARAAPFSLSGPSENNAVPLFSSSRLGWDAGTPYGSRTSAGLVGLPGIPLNVAPEIPLVHGVSSLLDEDDETDDVFGLGTYENVFITEKDLVRSELLAEGRTFVTGVPGAS